MATDDPWNIKDAYEAGFLDPTGWTFFARGVEEIREAFGPMDTGGGNSADSKRAQRQPRTYADKKTGSGTDKKTSSGTDKKTGSGTDYAPDDYAPSGYAPSMPEATAAVETTVSPWLIAGGLVAVVAAIAYVGTRK